MCIVSLLCIIFYCKSVQHPVYGVRFQNVSQTAINLVCIVNTINNVCCRSESLNNVTDFKYSCEYKYCNYFE